MRRLKVRVESVIGTLLLLNWMAVHTGFAACPNQLSPKCETIRGEYLSDYAGEYFSRVMNQPTCVPVYGGNGLTGRRIIGYHEREGGPIVALKECISDRKQSFYAKETLFRSVAATLAVSAFNSYLVRVAACNADGVMEGVDSGADCSTNAKEQWTDEVAGILVERDNKIRNAASDADDGIDSCISNYGGWTGECAKRYGA